MAKILQTMKLMDETKGALIYQALDEQGRELEIKDCPVYKIYVRKDRIGNKKPPYLRMTIDHE